MCVFPWLSIPEIHKFIAKISYGQANDVEFMNKISLEGKTNFFEKNNPNYSMFGVGVDPEQHKISFDVDFWNTNLFF